jgi:GNAT superfamily N-acetyltransferase
MSTRFSAPEPLSEDHHTDGFECGDPALDAWLKRRAWANQATGASRTYVVREGERVVAYYALASGAIAQAAVPGRFRRNMPDPIPVVLLARLAVDRTCQRLGLGKAMIRDAALRVAHAAEAIGIRGIVVHALSEDAKRFYANAGFDSCPAEPMTLVMTVRDLQAALGFD